MRVLVAILLAAAAGCSAEAARWDVPSGRWRTVATETTRTCTAFADVSPFAGGEIALSDHGNRFRWHPAVGVSVRYKPMGNGTYRRAVNTLYQGCQIGAEAYLTLGNITEDRLEGTYHVTYTRRTATDRCRSVPERCELTFDVSGHSSQNVARR